MKKIFAFVMSLAILNVSIAITPMVDDGGKSVKASAIMIPIGKTGQKISLADFSKLNIKQYEALAHVKLGFFDRMAYKMAMKKLKNGIAPDGTVKSKKILRLFSASAGDGSGFHLGGFALGFLVGIIGVIIAYVINDDNKSSRVKWAWLGFAAAVLLGLLLIFTAFKKVGG